MLENRVDMHVMRRMGRGWNEYFVGGTGTNQPQGLTAIAKAGKTAASATAVTYLELLDMEYSIDRAYRVRGEDGVGGFSGRAAGFCGWLYSDGFEKVVRTLLDSDNRPLWTPGIMAATYGLVGGTPTSAARLACRRERGTTHPRDRRHSGALRAFRVFRNPHGRHNRNLPLLGFSRTAQANSIEILGFSRRDSRALGAIASNKCEAFSKLTMG